MRAIGIGILQSIVVVALGVGFLWSMQRPELSNVGFNARLQSGTCVGWKNTTSRNDDGVMTWPNWADTDFEVTTGTVSIVGRRASHDNGTVNLGIFLNETSAHDWKVVGNPQALANPSLSVQTLVIDSAKRFSLRVLSHDYGAILINRGTTWASLGLSKTTRSQPSTIYVEVAGPGGSDFTLNYDQVELKGIFGERPPFSFTSWPPRYPEATRVWSSMLVPERLESRIGCVSRVAPYPRVELIAALGPLPTSTLKDNAHARFSRAVDRVVVSGVTGTLTTDAGQGRPIGPEDVLDVSGKNAQLSVDTQVATLALFGDLTELRVNNDDVRGRLIDGWPWYVQAGFWSLFGWAVTGSWQRRRELSVQARTIYRGLGMRKMH